MNLLNVGKLKISNQQSNPKDYEKFKISMKGKSSFGRCVRDQ